MGVFIDGMKMPVRCFECSCLDSTDGLYCGVAGLQVGDGVSLTLT